MISASDRFQFSISWKAEKKHRDFDSFVKSIQVVLEIFRGLSPIYANWYHLGVSRADALSQQLDLGCLEEEILKKSPKYKKQPEFGLTFSIWNGEPEGRDVNFSFRGLSESSRLDDFFSLELPYNLDEIKSESIRNGGQEVFEGLARLNPSFCLFTSTQLMNAWNELGTSGIPVGYKTLALRDDPFYSSLRASAPSVIVDGFALSSLTSEPSAMPDEGKKALAEKVVKMNLRKS